MVDKDNEEGNQDFLDLEKSPLEMLHSVQEEIGTILRLCEAGSLSSGCVRLGRLDHRVKQYIIVARNRRAWLRRGRQI